VELLMNFQTLKKLSQNLTLLYVEDDDNVRKSTARTFFKLFKQVDLAVDGEEGLELYNNFFLDNNAYYDIVISDIQMPRLDGIGMSKAIFEINKQQKIIIMSAYSDKEYLVDLINIGVEGFMQKPLASEQILEILYEVCSAFQDENSVDLGEGYYYDGTLRALFLNDEKIDLSDKELKLLELLVKNSNQSFSAEDIFNHIYYDQAEKEFSADSIKSLVKRLRKKIPHDIISNTQQLGYSINLVQ